MRELSGKQTMEEIAHLQADGFWSDAAGFQDAGKVRIRTAHTKDIPGIIALVHSCGPFLSDHIPYIYFIYTHCFRRTGLVAVRNGRIVGWCSVLPMRRGRYFMHQLALAPDVRGTGLAFDLFERLLARLRMRHGDDFRVEFTADRHNVAIRRFNRKLAERFHLDIRKLRRPVPKLDGASNEELYVMMPLRKADVVVIRAAA